MATEVERKFLLASEAWRADSDGGSRIMQGYLANSPGCTVRVRVKGAEAWLTIKGGANDAAGVQRLEYEYAIPLEDARELLSELAERPFIDKVRHIVPVGDHVWEIDEFGGDNAGLIVAEVELSDADESFEKPPWVGEEVSDDPRYLNAALVKRPFNTW